MRSWTLLGCLLCLSCLARAAEPAAKPESLGAEHRAPAPGGDGLPARLAEYLEKHRVRADEPSVALDTFGEVLAVIQRRPDPLTSFETFIFGIQRHSAKLLAPEQAGQWNDLLARHTPVTRRWHDERNLVRCQFERSRWDYAVADDAHAAAAKRDLERWLDLRMAWMFQEELAHDRFCREAWQILTAEQRRKILSGAWDAEVQKSTGHSYVSWAHRIVTRALGKPQEQAAFDRAVAAQQAAYAAPHQRYTAAAARHRRVSFALDVNSEELVAASWRELDRTFRAIVRAEADAIRVLCRAGYAFSPAELSAKAAAAQAAIWREGLQRFPAARELIQTMTN